VKFEERLRELASEIVENEAPDPVNIDWTGRDDLKDLNTPETALLVADLIAAVRVFVEAPFDRGVSSQYKIEDPLEALDLHCKRVRK